jgi:hypothetical protein
MTAIASWERPFQTWHYSVSYSRLLLRSVGQGFAGRVDVLFSNVRLMRIRAEYEALEISTEAGWLPPDIGSELELPGQWFLINSGTDYIRATHCQWHEDDGNSMTPSHFGPFRRTD